MLWDSEVKWEGTAWSSFHAVNTRPWINYMSWMGFSCGSREQWCHFSRNCMYRFTFASLTTYRQRVWTLNMLKILNMQTSARHKTQFYCSEVTWNYTKLWNYWVKHSNMWHNTVCHQRMCNYLKCEQIYVLFKQQHTGDHAAVMNISMWK